MKLSLDINSLKDKKIGLIGLGISNLYLANYLIQYTKNIFITESLPETKLSDRLAKLNPKIKYECGKHTDKIFKYTDLIIRSPGIPRDNILIKKILDKKIPVTTELEIAYQILKSKLGCTPTIIAITGTNGKTTTTTLVGKIISSYREAVICGNIGEPLIKFVDKIKKDTVVVIEVSSYQLEDIVQFKPHISCILNITEDHLDHHKSMKNYINAKFNIFLNQGNNDFAVVNYDDKNIRTALKSIQKPRIVYFSKKNKLQYGCWLNTNTMYAVFNYNNESKKVKIQTSLPGEHNLENITASVTCSLLIGIPVKYIEKSIKTFHGVEHRLEFVRKINGVVYINDSKSTNVDSTLVALKSFSNPIHLILGGRDKGAPYTPLIPLIKQKVKTILLIGEATEIIYKQIKNLDVKIYKCGTLQNAVKTAYQIAKKNEIVLLSPACSSFDQFVNFEHRGNEFKRLVNSL